MRVNQQYIQLLGDAVIPILGFFVWGWSLYFLLLFYFIDFVAGEILTHLKTAKTVSFHKKENKGTWMVQGFLSLVLLACIITLIHLTMPAIQPGINFQNEITLFWTYEELGIQQGYILVPIVFMVAIMQYKAEFIQTRAFETVTISSIWKTHLKERILILSLSAFVYGLSILEVPMKEWTLVLTIIVLTSLYRLLVTIRTT